MANTLPHTVNNRLYITYDGAYAMQIGYGNDAPYVYGTLNSFGKLLYKMNESVYLYDDLALTMNNKHIDSDSIAYEVWCAIMDCQGQKRGRKTSASVYIIDDTGAIVKHYRFGA